MLILLKKMMSALCDMKLLDTSLKSNGDLRKTTSSTTYCYDVVDMQAVSEPPVVANNSSVICKTFISCPNTPNTVVSFRIAASFPCNSRSLLSASLPQQSVAERGRNRCDNMGGKICHLMAHPHICIVLLSILRHPNPKFVVQGVQSVLFAPDQTLPTLLSLFSC